ncbi:hypothetical protein [Embleya sp. MST-111070]|uniref:hypothetical protein n=1 Tax=Embleya sp. MST-111070 TaxID=3398231 RepID=UPI003F734ED9
MSDTEFTDRLVSWLRGLDDSTLGDPRAVVRKSPGFYPTTILAFWPEEMARRGLRPAPTTPIAPAHLPVCHPGDFEWRFTTDTARRLVRRATHHLNRDGTVLHLGTPTTFLAAADAASHHHHVLLERNASVVDSLNSRVHDGHTVVRLDIATDPLPALEGAAAIVDPPWYPADTAHFLTAAATMCVPGARTLLCQPTATTRPGTPEERAQLTRTLPNLGFRLVDVEPSSVRYRMPHFEAVSLARTAPSVAVPVDWRTGDLLVLERRDTPPPHRPTPTPTTTDVAFDEIAFGPVRIKLRAAGGPDLGELIPGNILHNVSRRDPRRRRIGLWTSGNRAFTLSSPQRIARLIHACHTDYLNARFGRTSTLAHARKAHVHPTVAMRLFDVLLTELLEHLKDENT